MAVFSIVATGISIWAVRLLRDTLIATREAVKAADDAVEVTRDIGNKQLRAYLWIGVSEIMDVAAERRPRAQIGLKNYGQTPARVLSHKCWLALHHFPGIGEIEYPEAIIHLTNPTGIRT